MQDEESGSGFLDSKSPTDLLSDLITSSNIQMKSDVSIRQIKVYLETQWYLKLLNPDNIDKDPEKIWAEILLDYLELKVSLNRQSRSELIKALSQLRNYNDQENILMPKK